LLRLLRRIYYLIDNTLSTKASENMLILKKLRMDCSWPLSSSLSDDPNFGLLVNVSTAPSIEGPAGRAIFLIREQKLPGSDQRR